MKSEMVGTPNGEWELIRKTGVTPVVYTFRFRREQEEYNLQVSIIQKDTGEIALLLPIELWRMSEQYQGTGNILYRFWSRDELNQFLKEKGLPKLRIKDFEGEIEIAIEEVIGRKGEIEVTELDYDDPRFEGLKLHRKTFIGIYSTAEKVAIASCPHCGYYVHTMNDHVISTLKNMKEGEYEEFVCDCGSFYVIKCRFGYLVLHD